MKETIAGNNTIAWLEYNIEYPKIFGADKIAKHFLVTNISWLCKQTKKYYIISAYEHRLSSLLSKK